MKAKVFPEVTQQQCLGLIIEKCELQTSFAARVLGSRALVTCAARLVVGRICKRIAFHIKKKRYY